MRGTTSPTAFALRPNVVRAGTTCAALVVLALVVARSAEAQQRIPAPVQSPRSAGAGALSRPRIQTFDDEMVAIARQAPGFAGIVTDSTGTLTISVTSASRAAEVASAVAAYLARRGMPPARKVSFRRVDYSFDRLRAWYDRFISTPSIPGITSGYVDVVRNRVHVSGVNETTVSTVKARFAQLGVPKEAVIVDVAGPDVVNARD